MKNIKCEKRLSNLTESINFMTKTINEYEKDKAEEEKLAKDLKEEISSI